MTGSKFSLSNQIGRPSTGHHSTDSIATATRDYKWEKFGGWSCHFCNSFIFIRKWRDQNSLYQNHAAHQTFALKQLQPFTPKMTGSRPMWGRGRRRGSQKQNDGIENSPKGKNEGNDEGWQDGRLRGESFSEHFGDPAKIWFVLVTLKLSYPQGGMKKKLPSDVLWQVFVKNGSKLK